MNSIYESFMLDISGAAEIPVDKLFGRSPSGFNNGEETLQNYYDTIQEKQESIVRTPLEKLIRIITMSTIGKLPDDLEIQFNPVRRPADLDKADLAQKSFQPILDAVSANLIPKAVALREMKHRTPLTGLWTNITDEMIQEAEEEDRKNKEEEENATKELESYVDKVGQQKEEKQGSEKSNPGNQ